MSERRQALSRARCPACGTVFRVTAEQLRLKAGKVRCGHCQKVFNAFDHIQLDSAVTSALAAPGLHAGIDSAISSTPAPAAPEGSGQAFDSIPSPFPAAFEAESSTLDVATPVLVDDCSSSEDDAKPTPAAETLEETTQAAREVGLVAVRELNDSTHFNRWSAGALASDGFDDFGQAAASRTPVWLYRAFVGLLLLFLLGQLAHHYRTELVVRFPGTAAAYGLLGIDVPLPRIAKWVSIETSDLQLDNVRGLFVLNATLKNRAPHAQAWPSLELTLTDVNDRVVARRVIAANDYLPPDTLSNAFAANADITVRLWIEASGVGAAGYRLYIFYP